ncbi:hypothetical protein [Mycobacteroides saopaulense]|uniref:hypothetical protein n=1 Tax=Mycobacteroides saopaulense TaxID=1578165 RepID=UPI000721EBA9|nr:hypothetical protein [Mycobacteroides saopaulense]ALR11727.1 hypothetical protein MYCSP_09915 [Mycobacteroides saopaulense]
MDVPRCELPALVESLVAESAPAQRPPRPPSPAVDTSTPLGRAVAGFYLAFEAVDDSDRIREAADRMGREHAPEADSRQKYLALAHGITNVEKVRGYVRRTLHEITATAARTAERLVQDSAELPSGLNEAIHAAVRRESTAVCERAVDMINRQTRLVLDLDEVTTTITVDDWLTSHGLRG